MNEFAIAETNFRLVDISAYRWKVDSDKVISVVNRHYEQTLRQKKLELRKKMRRQKILAAACKLFLCSSAVALTLGSLFIM